MQESHALNTLMGKRCTYSISRKTRLCSPERLGLGFMMVAGCRTIFIQIRLPRSMQDSYYDQYKAGPLFMAKLLLSNSLLRTLGQELLVAELVKQAGHLRWKPWAEKGTHRLPESSCQPNLTASPQHLPHPSRVPSKPLLQTTQDFAFLSPRYGLENQKELKLLFLFFSQEGHGLKLGAVTMTMNTLALSTKAPRS